MSEHTPGPWKADFSKEGSRVLGPDGTPIQIYQHVGNTYLMAAAPELLEALKRIADPEGLACSDIPHCQGIGPFGHAEDCAVGIALAAIAKARGDA